MSSFTSSSGPRPLFQNRRVRWGILATGGIARTFAKGVATSESGEVIAVASRNADSARVFAEQQGLARSYGAYDDLLQDADVDAVYIATPHPSHHEWTLEALRAGKHVLCEKPMGMNVREAREMFGEAKKAGLLLMEAFMYRCHPQTKQVVELIRSGILGTIGSARATFSFHNRSEVTSRFYSRELGGGGILDVGCYPASFVRLVAGAAAGKAFLDPIEVKAVGVLHPVTGIDVHTSAVLKFENAIVAQISTGVQLFQDSSARIYGSKGWLHIPEPWLPNTEGRPARLVLHLEGKEPQEIPIPQNTSLYALEADAFARTLRDGQREVAEMSPADTIGNLQTMDRWRAEIGLTYPADKVGE
ncbi:MAG TPA: Gfo/Idh/MocA family oxidoreductase [Opitutaceae bacterium]|nr:Gfo/Idh/MocA family oxidoreductase [Opitutaceae bacterium]